MMAAASNTNMAEDNEVKFDVVVADSPPQHIFLMLTDCLVFVYDFGINLRISRSFFITIQYHLLYLKLGLNRTKKRIMNWRAMNPMMRTDKIKVEQEWLCMWTNI